MNNEGGYLRLRRGIFQHIREGRLTSNDWSVYSTIHYFADVRSGICRSNASSLAAVWGDFSEAKHKDEQFKNAMRRLRKNGYIDYPEGGAARGRGSYPILIDKFQPTKGVCVGWRLRLVAGEPGSSDFRNPIYQYDSPTAWDVAYPDILPQSLPVDFRLVQPDDTPLDLPLGLPGDFPSVFHAVCALQDVIRLYQDVWKTDKTYSTSREIEFLDESKFDIGTEEDELA